MTAVDRATDRQPAVRPVPRSGRAVATYVFEMKDREHQLEMQQATFTYHFVVRYFALYWKKRKETDMP